MSGNVSFQTGDPATPPFGTIVATDLIGGVNYQRVKVTWGPAGTATDTASGAGLPVAQDGAWSVNAVQSGSWSVAQSGTWNITNISGTISLPTGAATAAKQPALGTAGVASADVISVQGIASMTALKVDGSGVTQPVNGTVTVQQSTASNLKVDLSGTAANATAIKVDGSAVTQPVSGTVTVQQSTAANLKVDLSGTAANSTAIKVDGSAVTQPEKVAFQTTKALTSASISISSSGDNTVVAGTASQTIRIFKLVLVAASAVNVTVKDGASTSLTGAIPLAANGSLAVDDSSGEPEFITSSGNGFIVNLSSAVTVTGWVQYTKS